MVQSPTWEPNWFAVSQEIPLILRNPNVHYSTQASATHPYPGPAQSSPYTHILILEIQTNIIHPSTPKSP
jgi:hypothetical protein